MDNPKLTEISIDQIEFSDRTYIFTFESPISNLIGSIKKIGLLYPPMLEKKGDNYYRIISGFKRILALKHLKVVKFLANVFDTSDHEPDLDLFLLNLYENLATRNLNIIEKSTILYKLTTLFKLSDDQVMKQFLPLLDLSENRIVLDRFLKLTQLEDNLKIAVVEDFISIEMAIALLDRSFPERQAIFNLFQQLKLGKNRQKEFFGLLTAITEIESIAIDKLLHDGEVQNLLSNNRILLPRKTEHLKKILMTRRYPLYTAIEKNFQTIKKDLKLPPNLILRPPPFFEGDRYTIEFSFKNQLDFKKIVTLLKSIDEQNKLAELESLV